MSNMVVNQKDFQDIMEAVRLLHARLDVFEKAQQAQSDLNHQFREELTGLHSAIAKMAKHIRSSVSTTATLVTTTTLINSVFDQPQYTVLHLNRAQKTTHTEYRATLAAVVIDSKRILDVTFSACNVSTILIHVEYKEELLRLLTAGNLTEVPDFNPLDHKHVADTQFVNMPAPQLARIAAALHTNRCIRTVRYIKKSIVSGVLKFFKAQNCIPIVIAHDLSAELLSRPAKRSIDPRSTVGQLLLAPEYANQLCARPTVDMYGNVVDSNAMEIFEDFHDNAHQSDTDEDQE